MARALPGRRDGGRAQTGQGVRTEGLSGPSPSRKSRAAGKSRSTRDGAGNALEIDVVNLWANRVIGDLNLPKEKRVTVTHDAFRFDMITKTTSLLDSGLLGPVSILREAGENETF